MLKNAHARRFDTRALPNMHESRQSPALCLLKKRFVYVSGGKGKNCVECFDTENKTWTRVPQRMNMVRYMHASCAMGDILYVICGASSFSFFEKEEEDQFALIECLDTKSNAPWTMLKMTASLDFLIKPAVAALNNQ